MDIENAKAQMRKGVLELCILSIIEEDEVYPSDIIARLKSNDLIVVEGTLYPLLTRLKNDGLLNYSWRESNAGPPRKYFKITDLGRQFLEALSSSWLQVVQSVAQTVGKPPTVKKTRKNEAPSPASPVSPAEAFSPAEVSTKEGAKEGEKTTEDEKATEGEQTTDEPITNN